MCGRRERPISRLEPSVHHDVRPRHIHDSTSYLPLTSGIIHTMSETKRNPVIRVTPQTRKDLKVIAAETGETMQDVVARLAKQERERIQKGGKDVTQDV